MKQNRHFMKFLFGIIFGISAFLILTPQEAQATHFRYGHLTWQRLNAVSDNVRFTLVNAFTRNQFSGSAGDGLPAVGDIITENVGGTQLFFGDGNFTGILQYKVISINVTDNWIMAQALEPGSNVKTTIDHNYPSSSNGGIPWLAEINDCCRSGAELNNPNGDYRVFTYVETASGNHPPTSSLPAVVNVNQSTASTFFIPGLDVDSSSVLRFRLATTAEASGSATFNQPTDLTIDYNTGQVLWNTTLNASLGNLYSCQVIIEDRDKVNDTLKTQVAVDFLIHVVSCVPNNSTPYFTNEDSICGAIFYVNENELVSFTVSGADDDEGDIVELNSGGLPSGATMTPVLPTSGNPVSSVFSWTPGIGSGGSYSVTFSITDNCGAQSLCTVTITVIGEPCHLNVTGKVIQPTCSNSCDGSITANVNGGTGHYTYLWSNGETTKTISNLCEGHYTITVTDSVTQCTAEKMFSIKKGKVGATFTVSNVSCYGACDGSITVSGKGGNGGPFTYLWSSGETTATITGVCANVNYTVTVTDKKGCTFVCQRKVKQPTRLTHTISKVNNTGCSPNCNGSATANPKGGTQPYNYLWSDGQTTKTAAALCAGTYTVTVTDKNNCSSTSAVTITGNGSFNASVSAYVVPNNPCNFGIAVCNGSVSLTVNPPATYTYLWNSGETTSSITDKCAGQYNWTVTNDVGCSQSNTATIEDSCSSVRMAHTSGTSLKQVSAYPNPFNESLNINVSTDENLIVKVEDVIGRIIKVYENVNRSFVITEKLNNGIYFIKIENQSGSFTQTIKVIRTY